ncbi:magnesium and cobalt transporter CorA [Diaporthe helianthi]|uniref:Magnesium and cobalt transporter CorA n=1 Tax=Diaporthe helianthi TaxID=158607 RepID=A0A2P5IG99_DIAHE|nr:magnesium and cobalt transporter CorA [Diaporthe helianthi]
MSQGQPGVTARDFATELPPINTSISEPSRPPTQETSSQPTRVHYEVEHGSDTGLIRQATTSSSRPATRPDTEMPLSPRSPRSPIRRRVTRANTFKSIDDFSDFEHEKGWHPGAEPGLDPFKTDGGRASLAKLSAACEITVVDFSQDNIHVTRLDNDDVVSTLGKHKQLHKLAVEDLLNTRNRTKTDWYANHAFIVFTMIKLVRVSHEDSSSDSDSDSEIASRNSGKGRRNKKGSGFARGISSAVRGMMGRTKQQGRPNPEKSLENGAETSRFQLQSYDTNLSTASGATLERTVQRYNSGPNEARVEFMEKHAALSDLDLAVIAEQVSLFITQDNIIISFFELSADIIEKPILTRLYTRDTVLRQSCDASMVGQAIIDAVIDLAIPVATVYGDVIGDLELDILTRPNITHTKKLYIIITELSKILSFITPVINLINALRDHKTPLSQESATLHLQDSSKGVIITPMTYTYLGDVLDHSVLIQESLNAIKAQADGLINLIFNTIAAYQNESMKQLTLATLFFLPLTFLTGYFGQNFEPFTDLERGITFFWMIAAPMSFATILVLMREPIFDYIKSFIVRRSIMRSRKNRRDRSNKRR